MIRIKSSWYLRDWIPTRRDVQICLLANGAIAVCAKQLSPQRDLRIKITPFLPPQVTESEFRRRRAPSKCLFRAHQEYMAGSVSNLDLLTTEQSLVALDAAVASSDASLIPLQIDVFKALGSGWHNESWRSP